MTTVLFSSVFILLLWRVLFVRRPSHPSTRPRPWSRNSLRKGGNTVQLLALGSAPTYSIWVLTVARTGGGKIEQKTTCPTLYIIVTGRHLFIMEQCVPDPHTFCDAVSHPGPL